jgi:hypothetical protein
MNPCKYLLQLLPLVHRMRKPLFLARSPVARRGASSVQAVAAILLVMAMVPGLRAQLAVSQITTSSTNLSNQTVNGSTFSRETVSITTFKDITGNIYDANTTAGSAFIRRNTGAGDSNNSSTWYADGTTTDFAASYATTYSSLLLGNNLLRGSDNTFANGTDATSGNIERIDFLFSNTGLTSTIATAFAVFDRGAAGQHDNVKIAVITGWDSVNNVPTSYGGVLVGLTPTSYGAANVASDFTYNLFRSGNGDNLSTWTDNTETGTQGLGGATISMSDLGIAAGTTIYGYSLMGYDVTNGGSMTNLVNWNNATYYPTDTTGATGTGGIDLSAVNGVLYNKRVPEPSTYGAIFVGLGVAFFSWRRYRRGISVAAA